MTIAVIRTNVLPNDGRDDMNLDIDRWENDGGRNIDTSSNRMEDNWD